LQNSLILALVLLSATITEIVWGWCLSLSVLIGLFQTSTGHLKPASPFATTAAQEEDEQERKKVLELEENLKKSGLDKERAQQVRRSK
jgi:membrane protein required for beta-lactamase induction